MQKTFYVSTFYSCYAEVEICGARCRLKLLIETLNQTLQHFVHLVSYFTLFFNIVGFDNRTQNYDQTKSRSFFFYYMLLSH